MVNKNDARNKLLKKYDELYETLAADKNLMLKVLICHFGSIEDVWGMLFQGIHEDKRLEYGELECEIDSLIKSYMRAVDEVVDEEVFK